MKKEREKPFQVQSLRIPIRHDPLHQRPNPLLERGLVHDTRLVKEVVVRFALVRLRAREERFPA